MRALVLELVEGDTLADRVARGPLPIRRERSRSRGRSPTRSKPRTTRASSIAISNRPTSRSRRTGSSRCWTSGWRRATPGGGARRLAQLADDHGRRDRGRRDPRHRGLHEPGAGARPRGGQAHGRLGVRLRALRAAHGTAGVPGRDGLRHDRRDPEPRAGLDAAATRSPAERHDAPAPLSRERREETQARHRRRARGDRRRARPAVGGQSGRRRVEGEHRGRAATCRDSLARRRGRIDCGSGGLVAENGTLAESARRRDVHAR